MKYPMKYPVSSIWQSSPNDLKKRIRLCIENALGLRKNNEPVKLFFRADDIGVPGNQFTQMMQVFTKYKAPLCLAVVPAWLTSERWENIRNMCMDNSTRWCWHQHGWRHANHENTGKKQEFGPGRSEEDLLNDLSRGHKKLKKIMKNDYYQAFTPPWNRCSEDALKVLKKLGYKSISRSKGAKPVAPDGLPDFQVNVDLHTIKEPDADRAWENLFNDLETSIAENYCGIMIHHQRMNKNAFDFMELLFQELALHKEILMVNFKDM